MKKINKNWVLLVQKYVDHKEIKRRKVIPINIIGKKKKKKKRDFLCGGGPCVKNKITIQS